MYVHAKFLKTTYMELAGQRIEISLFLPFFFFVFFGMTYVPVLPKKHDLDRL